MSRRNGDAGASIIPRLMRHTNHIAPAQQSNRLTSQIDLFATLLDYVGISATMPTASRSFAPLLHGTTMPSEEVIFMEQEETRAIRTPHWLYMQRFKGAPRFPLTDALYHLVEDPGEGARVGPIDEGERAEIGGRTIAADQRAEDIAAEEVDLQAGFVAEQVIAHRRLIPGDDRVADREGIVEGENPAASTCGCGSSFTM